MGKIDTRIKQLDQKWMTDLTGVVREGVIYARNGRKPVPSEAITDAPTICLIANKAWWAHIAGVVDALTERRAWEGVSDDNAHAIQQILEFMEGVTCLDFQLRQSPTDACILEQSLDGGQTWIEAYNFLLCEDLGQAGAQQAVEEQTNTEQAIQDAQDALQNYLDNYINDITDLFPELGYDGSQNDGDRDRALCYALTQFVDAVCEASIAFYEEISETQVEAQRAAAVFAAVLGVAAIVATGGGAFFAAALLGSSAAALGLSSAFTDSLWKFWNNNTQDAFEDFQAREDVVCHAYDNMKGANATQAALITAFDGFSGSDNAVAIAGACDKFASQNAPYAVFAEALNYGFNAGKLGLLPGCPCETDLSVYEIDFASELGAWAIDVGTQIGTGIQGESVPGIGLRVLLKLTIPQEMDLRETSLEYTRANSLGSGTDKHVVSGWQDQAQTATRIEWLGQSFVGNGLRTPCNGKATGHLTRVVTISIINAIDTPLDNIILHKAKLVMASPAPFGKIDSGYVLCP